MADLHGGSEGTDTSLLTNVSADVTPSSPDGDRRSDDSGSSRGRATADSSRAIETAKVFQQVTNRNDFKRMIAAGVDIEEAYEGAKLDVMNLNPEYFRFAAGTRVVNLKTESLQNLFRSVKHGRWSTLEKVSQRITAAWTAKEAPDGRILFLVAINGHKHFCGLAELSGSWSADVTIDGWENNATGGECIGSMPVTWHFVKDVSFGTFHHVHQKRNGQPVVNMWNGMQIDSETVTQVIETYVTAPHYSNLLAWPKKPNQHSESHGGASERGQQKTNAPNRGGFGGRRQTTSFRGNHRVSPSTRGAYSGPRMSTAFASDNWRQPQQPLSSPVAALSAFPSPSIGSSNVFPPGFDGSHERAAAFRPGQVTCSVVDQDNHFTPVTSSPATSMVFRPTYGVHQDTKNEVNALDYERPHKTYGSTSSGHREEDSGRFCHGREAHLRSAKSSNEMRLAKPQLSPLDSHYPEQHRDSFTGTCFGIDNPLGLRHAASTNTLRSKEGRASTHGTPVITAPAAKAPMPAKQVTGDTVHTSEQRFDLRQAAKAPEFKPEIEDSDAILTCIGSSNPTGLKRPQTLSQAQADDMRDKPRRLIGVDLYGEPRYVVVDTDSQDHTSVPAIPKSDASYPDYFETADSMAGFDPHINRTQFQCPTAYSHRLPRPLEHALDTPTRVPRSSGSFDTLAPAELSLPGSGSYYTLQPGDIKQGTPASYHTLHSNDLKVGAPRSFHAPMPATVDLGAAGGSYDLKPAQPDPGPPVSSYRNGGLKEFCVDKSTELETDDPSKAHEAMLKTRRAVVEGAAGLPLNKQKIYYKLMSEKVKLERTLGRTVSIEDDQYYELLSRKVEVEDLLLSLNASQADSSEKFEERRGNAAAASITSSIQRFNISPDRHSDGRILESISRHGSPKAKGKLRVGKRSPGLVYDETPAARIKNTIYPHEDITADQIKSAIEMKGLDSPTRWSVAPVKEYCPPPDEASSSPAWPVSNRKTNVRPSDGLGIDADHENGSGGIRLES